MTDQAPTEALVKQEGGKVQAILKVAEEMVVKTDLEYVAAGEYRKATNGYIKNMEQMEKSATRPILDGLETIRSWFRPYKTLAKRAKDIIDVKITEFEVGREKERAAEEARLREKERIERERLLKQAEQLTEQGKDFKAAAKIGAAQSIPTPAVMPTIPKIEGMHHREEWDIEIVDRKLVPYEYWLIDEARIRKVVKAMDGDIDIPGVRNFKKRIQVSRAR